MRNVVWATDYGRLVRKSPSLHGRKSTPTPRSFGTAEAYFRGVYLYLIFEMSIWEFITNSKKKIDFKTRFFVEFELDFCRLHRQ